MAFDPPDGTTLFEQIKRTLDNAADTRKGSVGDGPWCDFCGKSRREVRKMIGSARGTYICNECVGLCQLLLQGAAT